MAKARSAALFKRATLLARAELLVLRLSAQLELTRAAFETADEPARDYALTHACELVRQLRENVCLGAPRIR